MAKDPAFLFYSSDFLTGTMFMTNEQIGIYMRLLCSQHQHGGMIDKISFNTLIGNNEIVKSKFIEVEDGFFNERLMIEIEKRNKKSSNLSANALKRWENVKQKKSKSNAIALQRNMPTENENERYNYIKEEYKISVLKWFKYKSDRKESYKSIDSEKSFYNKLLKLSNNHPQIANDIIEQSMANNWAGVFELKNNKAKEVKLISSVPKRVPLT